MKANQTNLLMILNKSPQFVIPIYQRNYAWTRTECEQLWADLMRAGRDDKVESHFMGAIVYVEQAMGNVTNQAPMLVIDGQQRLTTATLLIAALVVHLESIDSEPVNGFSADELRFNYLLNRAGRGDRKFRLILSETDRGTLLAVLSGTPKPDAVSTRIVENFETFRGLIKTNEAELDAICMGIAKLEIVDVALDRERDNPQLIFESMNSTGRELSQADLIRNFILMGLEPALQTSLYNTYWRPMEVAFGESGYAVHFDAFVRNYLTMKTGTIPKLNAVYSAFKTYAHGHDTSALVADIRTFASHYCAMALDEETDPALKQAFHDLRELKVDVAYPFLLDTYHDYVQQRLSAKELLAIVRMVESYVFRRAICAIPPNSMNEIFANLGRKFKKDLGSHVERVQAAFLLLQSRGRFPANDEFECAIKVRDLYNFPRRSFLLRRLENHSNKELVSIENYTIEHILPQNANLSQAWRDELGPDWKEIQKTYLHTLGNLTLTGYNVEYSDHCFAFKRSEVKDLQGNLIGLAYSPLRLNHHMVEVKVWDKVAIKARADRLGREAINVWGAPELSAAVLDKYRPVKPAEEDNISGHPRLLSGAMAALFQELRKQILALDPNVSEVFLRNYVAFKADTNFVDVVPQLQQLRLFLNLSFHEIDDPLGKCIDVSNKRHGGNGDVEVRLTSAAQLPYVVGLIRQSLDMQLDSPAEI